MILPEKDIISHLSLILIIHSELRIKRTYLIGAEMHAQFGAFL